MKEEENILELNKKVVVTMYRMKKFFSMFEKFYRENMALFREALNPKYNRDQVFKAGEGAGRSGSFFFFSHDR